MGEKICTKCDSLRPLKSFHKDRRTRDGRRSACRECVKGYDIPYRVTNRDRLNAQSAARYVANRDRALARGRAYYAATKEHRRVIAAARYAAHPERTKARQAVRTAINAGRMQREPCEVCAAGPAEAHHDDYGKPLDIRWLCRSCHTAHHKHKEKNADAG